MCVVVCGGRSGPLRRILNCVDETADAGVIYCGVQVMILGKRPVFVARAVLRTYVGGCFLCRNLLRRFRRSERGRSTSTGSRYVSRPEQRHDPNLRHIQSERERLPLGHTIFRGGEAGIPHRSENLLRQGTPSARTMNAAPSSPRLLICARRKNREQPKKASPAAFGSSTRAFMRCRSISRSIILCGRAKRFACRPRWPRACQIGFGAWKILWR